MKEKMLELEESEFTKVISKFRVNGNHEFAFKLELYKYIKNIKKRKKYCGNCAKDSYYSFCFYCLALEVNDLVLEYIIKDYISSKIKD